MLKNNNLRNTNGASGVHTTSHCYTKIRHTVIHITTQNNAHHNVPVLKLAITVHNSAVSTNEDAYDTRRKNTTNYDKIKQNTTNRSISTKERLILQNIRQNIQDKSAYKWSNSTKRAPSTTYNNDIKRQKDTVQSLTLHRTVPDMLSLRHAQHK